MKEKLTIVLECDKEKTMEIVSTVQKMAPTKSYYVEEIAQEKKVGFFQ